MTSVKFARIIKIFTYSYLLYIFIFIIYFFRKIKYMYEGKTSLDRREDLFMSYVYSCQMYFCHQKFR